MATVVFTVNAGGDAGSQIRALGEALINVAIDQPDRNSSGAAVTLTIDNAAAGAAFGSVTIAGGGGATRTVRV